MRLHFPCALVLAVALRVAADVFTNKQAFGRQQGKHEVLMDLAHHDALPVLQAPTTSVKRTPGLPVSYSLHDQYTWDSATEFCAGREGRLCTYEEICPEGVFKPPGTQERHVLVVLVLTVCAAFGIMEGDHFVAVSDEEDKQCPKNTWVGVGSFEQDTRLCKTHSVLAGCPGWYRR
jgi:hypothetical protein